MNKFKKFLEDNKIYPKEINENLIIICPFCKSNDSLNINKAGSWCCENSWCSQRMGDFSQLAEKLGLVWHENQEENSKNSQIENQFHSKREYHLWSMSEIIKHDFGEQDWIIDKLIPIETINILSGDPQNFKTWITIEMARCVALGIPFLNKFPTTQSPVLVVNEEDHPRNLKKRFMALQISEEAPIFYLSQEGIKVDNEEWLANIIALIREHSVKFIIFDSFIRIHSKKENDAGDMAYVFEKIRELVKVGVTVLITHHHRKESSYGRKNLSYSVRGSTDITAAVDCHLSVEKHDEDEEVFVYQNKLRVDESLKPFKILVSWSYDESNNKLLNLAYGGELPEKEVKKDKVKSLILEILKEGELSRQEVDDKIRSNFPVGKNIIGDVLKELEGENLIIATIGQKNKKLYSLPT